jgi:uncharacterized RDD family membrane protein YckC
MAWYYANQGQQAGPVDDAAFDNLVRQGVVRDDTLVWKDGMATWQAYSTVKPQPMAAEKTVVMKIPPAGSFPAPASPAASEQASAATTAMETRFCSQCGRPTLASQLTMVNGAPTCPACAAVLRPSAAPQPQAAAPAQPGGPAQGYQPQAAPQQGYPQQGYGAPAGSSQPAWAQMGAAASVAMGGAGMQAGGAYRFGGFWIRFVARLIDGILVGIAGFIITLPLTFLGIGGAAVAINPNDPTSAVAAMPGFIGLALISGLIRLALQLAYEVYFLTTRGATLGKIALGLKVIRTDGGPITMQLAVARVFASILSGLILAIGYIIAGFDPQKRSLHDRLCNTYVIYSK